MAKPKRAQKDDPALRRILIVLHQAHSTPGRVGRLLGEHGFALDIRRPSLGDPLPKTMRELWSQLGAEQALGPIGEQRVQDAGRWGQLPAGVTVTKGAALFPRLEEPVEGGQ